MADRLRSCLLLGLLPLTLATEARADSTRVNTAPWIDTVLFRPDNSLAGYSPVTNPQNFEQSLHQNPTLALFKSMAVPGLGQFGNRRYIKAVFFAGLDAWMVGSAIHYGRQASDFRSKFENETTVADRNDYYFLYQDRRDERNKFTWFAVIVTFISMFDAYVDAHLSGFPNRPVDNDAVSLSLLPSADGQVVAQVSLSF